MKILIGQFLQIYFQFSVAATGYDPHPVFTATYIVPTQNELSIYANWKIKSINFVRNNTQVSATYTMPQDLFMDGAQEIKMTGKINKGSTFFTMVGEKVQSVCSELGADSYICLLKFKKNQIKTQDKVEHFKEIYKNNDEAEKRILVARAFSSDPVGVLHIEKH